MANWKRRDILAASAAAITAPLVSDLGRLGLLSRAVAADTGIDRNDIRHTATLDELVKLMHSTAREKCIPVFVEQLQAGLSYQDFLSALLLATIEHGDPHQVAGVYSAHRVSSESPTEHRLLPLFWALDRVVRGFEEQRPQRYQDLVELPSAEEAPEAFQNAMTMLDPERAERAIVALARVLGPRRAMSLLWEHSARRVQGTLGHHPIMIANAWRTLEALGWQHSEPVLRYLARSFPAHEADGTHGPNLERAARTATELSVGWSTSTPNREQALEVFHLLRAGETGAACDLICKKLSSGASTAGTVWDAVHLVAADLLFRYKTGGSTIGGYLIHAVTSTNALRCGFDASGDDRVRLLLLLQAAAALGELFIGAANKEDQLREKCLVDLKADEDIRDVEIADLFTHLPNKVNEPSPEDSGASRTRSDQAAKRAFGLLQSTADQELFKRTARRLLCVKATENPHDLKYPVAAFEDAAQISQHWRPYLLASSVHALHGNASADAEALVQARAALK